jgi:hypothetical protein
MGPIIVVRLLSRRLNLAAIRIRRGGILKKSTLPTGRKAAGAVIRHSTANAGVV